MNQDPIIYSNVFNVKCGLSDFCIVFGRGFASDEINELGSVIMSPETAKLFHKILGKQIDEYEKTIGKINELPELPEKPKENKVIHAEGKKDDNKDDKKE